MPSSDFHVQYEALQQGRGFFPLTDWSSITLTGADRQKFLHNFCTNDVKRLAPGQSCEAFITNAKGKIIGYGLIDCRDDELVFVTVPNQAPALSAHLDRYIFSEDVQLQDTTSELNYLHAGAVMPANIAPSARWLGWKLLGRDTGAVVEIAASDFDQAIQSLTKQGYAPCEQAAFESLRIEAGTPLFGTDFDDSCLPQEVGREELTISFTKGCYLGQETVARLDALGHVNQQLTGVRFIGVDLPPAGTPLTRDGKQAGHVTSAAFSPRLNAPLAFAMVRRESLGPGTKLESAAGDAEVVALPLATDASY
jgi:folate-binding protein YgfZ